MVDDNGLPQPGLDRDEWGTPLNNFLLAQKDQTDTNTAGISQALAGLDLKADAAATTAALAGKADLVGSTLDPSQVPDLSGDYAALGGATFTGPVTAPVRDNGGQVWNVKAFPFNAVGNGESANPTDDAAAIQAAIAAAGVLGGTVLLPPVTYAIGTQIKPAANVALSGYGATIKLLASCTTGAILFTNVSNGGVLGLTIDLNKAATADAGSNYAQQGIYVTTTSTVSGFTFKDVTVKNGHRRGIMSFGGSTTSISDITVDNCTVTDCGSMGISLSMQLGSNAVVSKSTVLNSALAGVQVLTGSDATINGCIVKNAGDQGITVGGNAGGPVTATITGNHVTGSTKYGVAISWNVPSATVVGNVLKDNIDGGVTVDVEQPSALGVIQDADITVGSNTCSGSTTGVGVLVRMARGVAVQGNKCSGNATNGIALTTSSDCAVTGNVVKASGNHGVYVSEASAAGGHTFAGNKVSGSAMSNYSVTATNACAFATTSATPPA